jgi:small subunit ribosomal protein S6
MTTRRSEQTMRTYEAVIIFRPDSELRAEGREFARSLFTADGCKVLKEDEMGDREMAYEVKGSKRGFYVVFELETSPESISAFDRALKLRSEILKYLFVRKDK